ncbi:hypothetical protein [Okeania sp. SIO2C9]|nr:hypothetical protein [Okeania sp. SIO2C9]
MKSSATPRRRKIACGTRTPVTEKIFSLKRRTFLLWLINDA